MLLPGILQRLVLQLPQTQRDAAARGMRLDHLVDEALARRDERVGESRLTFRRPLGDLLEVSRGS